MPLAAMLWLCANAFADSMGYVQFIAPSTLAPLLKKLPAVENSELSAILKDPLTMWYDAKSMRPVYQDSVTPVLGVRANSLGLEIAVEGERIFNESGFHFPFKNAVGLDETVGTFGLTFWSPPRGTSTLPVAYYKDDTTRWRWIFPKGTVFGEVFFLKGPNQESYVFEIRTRKRLIDGWESNIYRPFESAATLAQAIQQRRPHWESTPTLRQLVEHLYDGETLQTATLESSHFAKAFDPVRGALDFIPPFEDDSLVIELLTQTTFRSLKNQVWKRTASAESYGPSTHAGFSIVPARYKGGLFAVNDQFCNRCHEQTGRQIGEFNFNTLLYGEIWGEDRTFSWHLFDESGNFDGAFHQNRILSTRLKAAELTVPHSQSAHPADTYKALPRPFKIYWK